MGKVRWWLVGILCIACGIISRVYLARYAPPQARVNGWQHAAIVGGWLFTGLLLLAAPLARDPNAPNAPTRGQRSAGCLALAAGAVVAFYVAVSARSEE